MTFHLIVLLSILNMNFCRLIIASDGNQYIISPLPRRVTTIDNQLNASKSHYIHQIPTAKRIWDIDYFTANCTKKIVIQQNFTVPCRDEVKLYIASSGPYSVQLNGVTILIGNTTEQLTYIVIPFSKLKMIGTNILNFYVQMVGNCTPARQAGLIYALTQSDEPCYNCAQGQYWDAKYRQCRCIRSTDCLAPRQWVDQPVCRCLCVMDIQCANVQYYDHSTCTCVCLPKLCPNGAALNPNTCQC